MLGRWRGDIEGRAAGDENQREQLVLEELTRTNEGDGDIVVEDEDSLGADVWAREGPAATGSSATALSHQCKPAHRLFKLLTFPLMTRTARGRLGGAAAGSFHTRMT